MIGHALRHQMNRMWTHVGQVAGVAVAFIALWPLSVLGGPRESFEADSQKQSVEQSRQIDQVVEQFWNLIDLTESIARRLDRADVMSAARASRETIGEMSDEDLLRFVEQLPDLSLIERQLLEVDSFLPEVKRNREAPAASTPSAFPGGGYSSQCGSSRLSTAGALATVVARQVVESVAILAKRACNLTIAGNDSSSACIVTDGVYLAAKVAEEHILFCVADIDSAEILGSFDRLGHIHSDLTDARLGVYAENDTDSSILANEGLIDGARDLILKALGGGVDSILSAIEAMATKVQDAINMHFAEQNEELRAWREYQLKLWIEEDLGRATGEHRIGSFQLPASIVCPSPIDDVPCGSLESVEQCVKDTIANMDAAGQLTFDAEAYLAKARHAFAKGEYKIAYDTFSIAYRLATAIEQPPVGACCDGAGGCEDSVWRIQCAEPYETWHESTACADVDPPCDSGFPAMLGEGEPNWTGRRSGSAGR